MPARSPIAVAVRHRRSCAGRSGRGRRPPTIGRSRASILGLARRTHGCSGDDRARGGDRRRRSDGADAGGRAGVGGRRRRHCRAARQPGPPRLARGRSAVAHDRGPRPARDRRSVPRGGTGGPGRGVRRRPPGHQRLSHPASLRARAVAEAHRAHPRRLGRRAEGADPLRHRGDRLRAGRHRRRRRAVRRPVAAGASTSSGATADAAWSARQPASSSPAGIRRRAACSPRSR